MISNFTNTQFFLISILLSHLIISFEFLHWVICKIFCRFWLILSEIALLAFLISFCEGLTIRHGVNPESFSSYSTLSSSFKLSKMFLALILIFFLNGIVHTVMLYSDVLDILDIVFHFPLKFIVNSSRFQWAGNIKDVFFECFKTFRLNRVVFWFDSISVFLCFLTLLVLLFFEKCAF